MITIYDIAKKAGVSPSTVSKVINDYKAIPEETKEKVHRIMDEMNYIPNTGAKSLSSHKSYNVGILAYFGMKISPFKHTLFTDILDSFQTEMNNQNYDLIFISHNVAGQNGSFYKNCMSRDVAGVLLFGDINNKEMKEVVLSSIPKVCFDYVGGEMTSVQSDNYAKMKELTKCLIDLGHRNIFFVHGEPTGVTSERISGFKSALKEAGIPLNDAMLQESMYLDKQHIRSLTTDILRQPSNVPTAIMYPDDYSAIQGIAAIREEGLRCPNDISVTGFDGIFSGQVTSPRLTTVKQNTEEIGRALAKSLIECIERKRTEPHSIEIKGTILVGESTGPARK
ncbi:MAG: LacI family transcriptional regulator [Bacilli bacterium]|jgi:DNA-binding LacI/PurR family transcriptional regulator|nr:LacI family transcriptional regulator [Bacilli bacterium]